MRCYRCTDPLLKNFFEHQIYYRRIFAYAAGRNCVLRWLIGCIGAAARCSAAHVLSGSRMVATVVIVAFLLPATIALDNGLARTPQMGYNSWCE